MTGDPGPGPGPSRSSMMVSMVSISPSPSSPQPNDLSLFVAAGTSSCSAVKPIQVNHVHSQTFQPSCILSSLPVAQCVGSYIAVAPRPQQQSDDVTQLNSTCSSIFSPCMIVLRPTCDFALTHQSNQLQPDSSRWKIASAIQSIKPVINLINHDVETM
jgi:hypothetical protein